MWNEILLFGYLIQKNSGVKWIWRDELSFHNFQKFGKPLCKIFKALRKFLWWSINSKIYSYFQFTVIDANCKTAAWSASWKFSTPTVYSSQHFLLPFLVVNETVPSKNKEPNSFKKQNFQIFIGKGTDYQIVTFTWLYF